MQREFKFDLLKETVRIAWPAVLESSFVALASMIDTLMVASVGSYAVAAVGITTQPKFLMLVFFLSANIAVSALIARRRGEDRRDKANEILCSAFCYTVIGCVIVTIFCLFVASSFMRLCGSGNTRIAMTTNVTSSLVNVFFNYLLIGVCYGHL